jgi:hypothetical protein
MIKLFLIFILSALFSAACIVGPDRQPRDNSGANQAASTPATPKSGETDKSENTPGEGGGGKTDTKTDDRAACLGLKIPGRKTDARQTFAIDFEPYGKSCFVTAHDPEFTDPPLGSEFFIYRDGREAFKLPNPFNGTTTGCWAEAVSFQDLNSDGLTDIIIAGMCSAKSSPYSENMVYVNTGRDFRTSEDANLKLNDFKRIKDIADFVKRNQDQFF